MPPSRRAGAGAGRRGGGWGRKPPHRELRFPAAWPPPGAEGLCTFLRREKGLRLFFSIFCSLNKQTSRTRRFWACPKGSGGGLGEGRGFAPFRTKMRTPSASLTPFQKVQAAPRGLVLLRCGRPHPQDAPSPAQESPRSRQGPPQRGGARRLPRGPGLPAPAQPVPGSGSFINQRLGERAAL